VPVNDLLLQVDFGAHSRRLGAPTNLDREIPECRNRRDYSEWFSETTQVANRHSRHLTGRALSCEPKRLRGPLRAPWLNARR